MRSVRHPSAGRCVLTTVLRDGPRALLAFLFVLGVGLVVAAGVLLSPRAFRLLEGPGGAFFLSYVFTLALAAAGLVLTAVLAFAGRRGAVIPDAVLDRIADRSENGDRMGAMEVCAVQDSSLSRVVFEGLARSEDGRSMALEVVDAKSREEELAIEARAGWLQSIAVATPMVGALGLVVCMAEVFEMTGVPRCGCFDPFLELAPALVPFAIALAASIPATVAHGLFHGHAVRIGWELRSAGRTVVERLVPRGAGGARTPRPGGSRGD